MVNKDEYIALKQTGGGGDRLARDHRYRMKETGGAYGRRVAARAINVFTATDLEQHFQPVHLRTDLVNLIGDQNKHYAQNLQR